MAKNGTIKKTVFTDYSAIQNNTANLKSKHVHITELRKSLNALQSAMANVDNCGNCTFQCKQCSQCVQCNEVQCASCQTQCKNCQECSQCITPQCDSCSGCYGGSDSDASGSDDGSN